MNPSKYSIWLLLSKEDEAYISETIQLLGEENDAPIFEPHCTLFSPISDLELTKDIINEISINPFQISTNGLNHSDLIWKSLFIELKTNIQLTIMNQLFDQSFAVDYDFQPHISLIYKELNMDTKKTIIEKLTVKNSYRMSSLAIVDTTGPVEMWETVHEVFLNK